MTRTVLLAAWAFVALLFVTAEALSMVSRRRYVGFASLLDGATRTTLRVLLVFVGWMWIGWHFFAR